MMNGNSPRPSPFADLGKQEFEDTLACLAYTTVYLQAIQGLGSQLQPENVQEPNIRLNGVFHLNLSFEAIDDYVKFILSLFSNSLE